MFIFVLWQLVLHCLWVTGREVWISSHRSWPDRSAEDIQFLFMG